MIYRLVKHFPNHWRVLALCFLSTPTLLAADAPAPTKEMAIKHLQAFLSVLDTGDFDKALTYIAPLPDLAHEDQQKMMRRLVEAREITRQGIEVLAAKGQWGKLADIHPDKSDDWARKFHVPPDQCWALAYEGAEAAFHFEPRQGLKIIRCNDIGKLKK